MKYLINHLIFQLARETRTIYQDHYFLTDPDKFIFEFYPLEQAWQLMEQPITMQVRIT